MSGFFQRFTSSKSLQTARSSRDGFDDTAGESNEIDDLDDTTGRGTVSFECQLIKNNQNYPKTFELNLYSGNIRQISTKKQKVIKCSDIFRVTRGGDSTITIEIRQTIGQTIGIGKQKLIHFETVEEARQFQAYIEYHNEYGHCIRAAFNYVDVRDCGYITKATVRAAIIAEDLQPTDRDIDQMFEVLLNFLNYF